MPIYYLTKTINSDTPNKIFLFLLSVYFVFCASVSYAHIQHKPKAIIKIAILDSLLNVENQYASNKYVTSYVNGIHLASEQASLIGLDIQCKNFFYPYAPLQIFQMLPAIEKWHPDVIVGPRWSDQFLLLKNSFKNIMVISPFATATEVYQMAPNFYSISPPNQYLAKAILQFKQKNFSNTDVFMLVQADCKTCVDLRQNIEGINQRKYAIQKNYFLERDVENINIETLMRGYKNNTPIILLSGGYSAGVLMARITDYLKLDKLTFIGGDDWGSWSIWDAGKIKSLYNYQGFRISPWSTNINTTDMRKFKALYLKKYHEQPDSVAYLSYRTINSIIQAVKIYPNNKQSMRQAVLVSYQSAVRKNLNWFRPNVFAIYHLDQHGEQFFGSLSIQEES